MKLLKIVFLCIGMIMLLVACGEKTNVETNEENKEITGTGENNLAIDNNEEQQPIVATEESGDMPEYTIYGTWNGHMYKNSVLDVTINFPDDWTYLSQEELEKDTAENGDDASQYVLYATGAQGNSMIIVYQDADDTNVDVTMYEQELKTQMESVEEIEYKEQKTEDVSLGKNQYRKLEYIGTEPTYQMSVYQNYYIRKDGNHMICMITTGFSNEQIAEMESYIR